MYRIYELQKRPTIKGGETAGLELSLPLSLSSYDGREVGQNGGVPAATLTNDYGRDGRERR